MRAFPPDFELVAPSSLDEVLGLMAGAPGEWTPIAGGTDLMVVMEAGDLKPGRFVSVWGLPELAGVDVGETHVTMGALTTYTQVRRHPILLAEAPMLCQAAALSGAIAIQNRGTLGGNIVNASPAADSPPALLAYDAEIELRSTSGARWIPYAGFHTGYKEMAKRPDELVTRVRIPRQPGGEGALHYYRKVGTRKAQAISKACFAAVGRLDGGRIAHVRLALGAVGPTVIRATKTEALLVGQALSGDLRERARASLAEEISPIGDIRSTKDYRAGVCENLIVDFLRRLSRG